MNESDIQWLRMNRRRLIGLMGAVGTVSVLGCKETSSSSDDSSSSSSSSDTTTSSTTTTSDDGSCVLIPEETEGPYPLSAVLSNSAMVRADITDGKTGVPLTLTLRLVDTNDDCAPITTAASVYVWHCDKDGLYSGYNQPGGNTVGETFLRGIQDVDDNGEVTFTTIFPGWYNGRITHIHFQVFLYSNSTASATSQLAFPQAVTEAAYDSSLYTNGQNTSVSSIGADNIFSDGYSYQLVTISGSVDEGYEAELEVGIDYG